MVSEDFQVGDLVWAKMKSYPPWPARIADPRPDLKAPKNKKAHFVYFFGSENVAWILDENISHHSESALDSLSKNKSKVYQKAIDDLISYSKKRGTQSPLKRKKVQEDDKGGEAKLENSVAKKQKKKVSTQKAQGKTSKKSFSEINGGRRARTKPKVLKNERDRPLKFRDCSPASRVQSLLESFPSLSGSRKFYERCMKSTNDVLDRKHVKPSQMRFGFIGLGHMGKAIVRNMIESGHNVSLWNRSPYKSKDFMELGATVVSCPADLIVACDVTFCCVSDPDASKKLIFVEKGILMGLDEAEKLGLRHRGYVEMTSLDPQTSREISEAICGKHGLYLEAPLCGTSKDAEDGTLLVVASGDRRLFAQCETCFHAIGKHAFYLTCEVGYSAKMTLFLSMFSGTVCAAIAEAMVLAERLEISKKHFLDLLCFGPLNCDDILKKMEMMRHRDISALTSVRHIQKDINLALTLANSFSQPMPVTAAANEVYKLARLLKHSENDAGDNAVHNTQL